AVLVGEAALPLLLDLQVGQHEHQDQADAAGEEPHEEPADRAAAAAVGDERAHHAHHAHHPQLDQQLHRSASPAAPARGAPDSDSTSAVARPLGGGAILNRVAAPRCYLTGAFAGTIPGPARCIPVSPVMSALLATGNVSSSVDGSMSNIRS